MTDDRKRTRYKNAWARENREKTYTNTARYWVRRVLAMSVQAGRITKEEADRLEGVLVYGQT